MTKINEIVIEHHVSLSKGTTLLNIARIYFP